MKRLADTVGEVLLHVMIVSPPASLSRAAIVKMAGASKPGSWARV